MHFPKSIKLIFAGLFVALAIVLVPAASAFADDKAGTVGVTVSPMYQKKVLAPGYTEVGTFTVSNPAQSAGPVSFSVEIRPFSYDSEKGEVFAEKENYSEIVDWITLETTEGTLEPNEHREISFTIDVPEDTTAGGQYAAIIVKSLNSQVGPINESFELAHLIYAEVSGEAIRKGNVDSAEVPGFLLSGDIYGGATITNEGNVHSYATQVLKVLPLFGNEEYFTNEEDPQSNLIMPDATRYTSVKWDGTPSMGIFRVKYAIEFEGVTSEVEKVVIVCPLWLLITIVVAIALLFVRIFFNKKDKEHQSRR